MGQNIFSKGNKFTSIQSNGSSIVINGESVIINGKKVNFKDMEDYPNINLQIVGDVTTLEIEMCKSIEITGSVGNVHQTSGDLKIKGSVNGNVQLTSGDVEIGGNVSGNVQTTSGDVKAKIIKGSTRTMSGDITSGK